MKTLSVKKLHPEAKLPTRAHPEDAGLDLYSIERVRIPAGEGALLRTGVAMEIPEGYVGLVTDRSSLARRGLKTGGGIIDAGYRGEVHVIVRNVTQDSIEIELGERMAQMLILPIARPEATWSEKLTESRRGTGGFGSTGK
jgi:dUTP pyrophosphatase